ncbi:hypothetical protein FOZ62_022842 [Perkinsus olseni]|uniref:Uncharacterized protein n=3 Tax=Perkinsus olseni TaxID=32597 RepID=A0A7J6QHB4_PEROL|nr:hypothetical protein FOZ62_022842 [Perkinsus olseni]
MRTPTSTTPNTAASTTDSPSPPTTPVAKRSGRTRGTKRKTPSPSATQSTVSSSSSGRRGGYEPAKAVPEVLGSVRLRSVHARVLSWSADSDLLVSLQLGSDDGLRKWTRMLTMMRRDGGSQSDPDHRVVVIFDANVSMAKEPRVSGFMWFSSNSPSEIMIRDTWVDPQRRRLGIGSRMVQIFATTMVSSLTGDHSSNSSSGSSSSVSTRASTSGDEYAAEYQPVDFDPKIFRVLALPAPGSTTFWESNLFSGDGQSGGFLQLTWDAMVRLAQPGMDAPETPSRKAARTSSTASSSRETTTTSK